jgi:hypothetical protein
MRLRESYLVLYAAITLTRPLCATLCLQFPSQIYGEAKSLFTEWQPDFRCGKDCPFAVKLHDLILDDFDAKKAEAICGNGCKKSLMVNQKVGKMALTSMHVAAMMGRIDALTWLLKQGGDVNARDARDFTPAHFAALDEKSDALDYLESVGADIHSKNRFRATPIQLKSLTHLTNPKDQRVNVFDDFSQRIERIDGDIFCVLMGATFVEGLRQKPEDVLRTWGRDETFQENAPLQWATKGLDSYKSIIQDFYLKQITPRKGFELLDRTNYGLFSNKAFEPGDVVGVYAGEWKGGKAAGKVNLVETKVNDFCGYLPFARVGFPNIVLLPFANRFGVPEGNFALAVRPIAPGDAIYLEAPIHEIKVDIWKEPNPDALDAYLVSHPLSQLKLNDRNPEDVMTLQDMGIATYISRMVPVFIRLIAEEKVSVSAIKYIMIATGLSIKAASSEDGKSVEIFEVALNAMQKHFGDSITRRFYARKALEGDGMVLLNALFTMEPICWPLHSMSEGALESFWYQTRVNVCKAPDNARLRTCVEFSKQQHNKL